MALTNHPYADLFPMMTPAELDALAEDIAANGLMQPIVLYKGQVLDGRNRRLACKKAGIENPPCVEHEGDEASALALVISLNAQRRDLTAGQRAMVAAKALPHYEAQAKERQGKRNIRDGQSLKSAAAAGRAFKVGEKAVQQAKALLADAPDLAVQVDAGLSLAAGYEQLQERRKQAEKRRKQAELIAEYKDAVDSGEMSFEEALEKVLEEKEEANQKREAEADARRTWLTGFAEHLSWFERFLYDLTDEHLAWYTLPNSPGLFEHGITADRIAEVAAQLNRARSITFRGQS